MRQFKKDSQYFKFCFYGFFKNLRFFEPFFMLFFIGKDMSYVQIGGLYALREIIRNLFEIPTGFFADVIGRRKTMMISFLGYIISFLVFYFASNFIWLVGAMMLFSFGDAMRTGTHKAMIFDYLKLNNWSSEKVEYYGYTRSWSQFGSAISSVLAALFVFLSGNYSLVFLVSIIPYVVDLFLVMSYPKILDGPIKTISDVRILEKTKLHYKQMLQSISSKSFWMAVTNISIFHGYFKAVKDYLQPIIVLIVSGAFLINDKSEEKITAVIIGAVYFVIYLFSSVASRNAGRVAGWFISKQNLLNLTLVIGIVIGFLSGLVVNSKVQYFAVVLFVFIFIIQNIRKPVGTSLLAEQVKNNVLATGLSIQSQFDSIVAAILAIILGFIADAYNIAIALMVIGFLLMVCMPLFILKGAIKK